MGKSECGCGCGDEDESEMSMEEIVESNNVVLNALIDLLIEKKLITEDALKKKLDEMEEHDHSDEDSEDDKY